MRVRSVSRPIDRLPDFSDNLGVKLPRGQGQPDFAKTPRGVYTGDRAIDWREVQAWPKGVDF
ncbi:MAG: hypothetical protein AMS14_08790, partial [Planctomycetes bacterium DG_20]